MTRTEAIEALVVFAQEKSASAYARALAVGNKDRIFAIMEQIHPPLRLGAGCDGN